MSSFYNSTTLTSKLIMFLMMSRMEGIGDGDMSLTLVTAPALDTLTMARIIMTIMKMIKTSNLIMRMIT